MKPLFIKAKGLTVKDLSNAIDAVERLPSHAEVMNNTVKFKGYSTEGAQKPRYSVHADLELASEYYLNKSRRWFRDNHIGIALPPLVNSK